MEIMRDDKDNLIVKKTFDSALESITRITSKVISSSKKGRG